MGIYCGGVGVFGEMESIIMKDKNAIVNEGPRADPLAMDLPAVDPLAKLYDCPIAGVIIRMIAEQVLDGEIGFPVNTLERVIFDILDGVNKDKNPLNKVEDEFDRMSPESVIAMIEEYGIRVNNLDTELAYERLRRECSDMFVGVLHKMDSLRKPYNTAVVVLTLVEEIKKNERDQRGMKIRRGTFDQEKHRDEYIRILDALCYLMVGHSIAVNNFQVYCERIRTFCKTHAEVAEVFGKMFADVVNQKQGILCFGNHIRNLRNGMTETEYLDLIR